MTEHKILTENKQPFLHHPSVKILFCLSLILTGVFTPLQNWTIWVGVLLLELLLLVRIKAEKTFWLKQLPWFLFFMGTIAASIPLTLQFQAGWERAGLILVRGLIAFGASMWLMRVLTSQELVNALKSWRFPSFLVESLAFMLRYLSLLDLERRTLGRTRNARTFAAPSLKKQWLSSGSLIAQLVARSFRRAERIYRAMKSRNWERTP